MAGSPAYDHESAPIGSVVSTSETVIVSISETVI
jgi:hypothetical protein